MSLDVLGEEKDIFLIALMLVFPEQFVLSGVTFEKYHRAAALAVLSFCPLLYKRLPCSQDNLVPQRESAGLLHSGGHWIQIQWGL